MISWLFSNVQNLVAVLEMLGFAVLGVLVFMGFFGSKNNDRRAESDTLADGLINRLKQTVEQQTADIASMTTRMDDQQKEIHVLQGKNEAYLQILTLRDPAATKVFEAAPEIHRIIRETAVATKHNGDAMQDLTKTLSRFIDTLQPLLIHLELAKPSTVGV